MPEGQTILSDLKKKNNKKNKNKKNPSKCRLLKHLPSMQSINIALDIKVGYPEKIFFYITKTCLFKYIENFITKTENFQIKKNLIFFIFLLKT